MRFEHQPVMVEEVVHWIGDSEPLVMVDGTLGGGGHASALLASLPSLRLVGIDRAPEARVAASRKLREFGQRASVHAGTCSEFPSVLDELDLDVVDGLFVDIGVSSYQLDTATRGFSFRTDASLDMRMNPQEGQSAAELIAACDVDELTRILWRFGEEKNARRFARAIKRHTPSRTLELASLLESLVPASRGRTHPATRTFQALRIAVNDELGELERWLDLIPEYLSVGGVAAVITFHSLEDRRVKQRFRALSSKPTRSKYLPDVEASMPEFELPFRRALAPSDAECQRNPRARSAKLRVIRRRRRVS